MPLTIRATMLSLIILFLYSCFGAMSMEFNSARSYVRIENNLEEGEKWALKALEIEPDNAQVPYFLAVEVYRPQKNYDKMGTMFQEALRRNSNIDLEEPFKSGNKIIRTIHEAIRNEASTYYNKASSYYNKGKKKKAEKTFKMSMALNPELIDNYVALSDMAYEAGDMGLAIEYLDKGAKINSGNFDLVVRKAKYQREMKQYDEAIFTLQNIAIANEQIRIMLDKEVFMIYLEQEKYNEAVEIGSIIVESMFNSIKIDDKVLSETCYNVAICNRYLGYESYNKIIDTINEGVVETDILSSLLDEADKALSYFKTAKERFYDASSFDADDKKSTAYAKDLNKLIKSIKTIFIPQIKELINK